MDERPRKRRATTTSACPPCPYLDTIQRSFLDLDLVPVCQVSLETGNSIYQCLVCGAVLRGRGRSTPAFVHAIQQEHYLVLHRATGDVYCLPEDYKVEHPADLSALEDIRNALHPTFTQEQLQEMDRSTSSADMIPGLGGLNNLGTTDALNALVQAMAHVSPFRNFFLLSSQRDYPNTVTTALAQTLHQLWSPHRLSKQTVDPHALVQAIQLSSGKFLSHQQQPEAGAFLRWLLHQWHLGTMIKTKEKNGKRKKKRSIVQDLFQGRIRVTTRTVKQVEESNKTDDGDDERGGSDDEKEEVSAATENAKSATFIEEETVDTTFFQITLEIPEKPLFRSDETADGGGGLVIPQEPLARVLQKIDGVTWVPSKDGRQSKRYQILELPRYLILHLDRFASGQDDRVKKKNPTIVMFPVTNLDMSEYLYHGDTSPPTKEAIAQMSVQELLALLNQYGNGKTPTHSFLEKSDLLQQVLRTVYPKYNLVANITHDAPPDVGREGIAQDPLQDGTYKCHVRYGNGQWYEVHDDHVQPVLAQQVGLSQSLVLFLERQE